MNNGDFVKINYIGRLDSGEIFDLTYEDIAKKNGIYNPNARYGPVSVIVGGGMLLAGLDNALLEMNIGERKNVSILPKDGFGERSVNLIRVYSRKMFENPVQGMIVHISGMVGRIQSVSAGRVRIDFNNPLAGKNLVYEISVEEKIEGAESKIKAICDFFGVSDIKVEINQNRVNLTTKQISPKIRETISSFITKYVKTDAKINIEHVDFAYTE